MIWNSISFVLDVVGMVLWHIFKGTYLVLAFVWRIIAGGYGYMVHARSTIVEVTEQVFGPIVHPVKMIMKELLKGLLWILQKLLLRPITFTVETGSWLLQLGLDAVSWIFKTLGFCMTKFGQSVLSSINTAIEEVVWFFHTTINLWQSYVANPIAYLVTTIVNSVVWLIEATINLCRNYIIRPILYIITESLVWLFQATISICRGYVVSPILYLINTIIEVVDSFFNATFDFCKSYSRPIGFVLDTTIEGMVWLFHATISICRGYVVSPILYLINTIIEVVDSFFNATFSFCRSYVFKPIVYLVINIYDAVVWTIQIPTSWIRIAIQKVLQLFGNILYYGVFYPIYFLITTTISAILPEIRGISKMSYTLGITPGELVLTKTTPYYLMDEGQYFSVRVKNAHHSLRCNCELMINGELIATYRLLPESTYTIKTPNGLSKFFFDGADVDVEAIIYPENPQGKYGPNCILPEAGEGPEINYDACMKFVPSERLSLRVAVKKLPLYEEEREL